MKYGYIAIVLIATIFALIYGLLNQIDKQPWWAFGYIALVLVISTTAYLIGWKFSHELEHQKKDSEKNDKDN